MSQMKIIQILLHKRKKSANKLQKQMLRNRSQMNLWKRKLRRQRNNKLIKKMAMANLLTLNPMNKIAKLRNNQVNQKRRKSATARRIKLQRTLSKIKITLHKEVTNNSILTVTTTDATKIAAITPMTITLLNILTNNNQRIIPKTKLTPWNGKISISTYDQNFILRYVISAMQH